MLRTTLIFIILFPNICFSEVIPEELWQAQESAHATQISIGYEDFEIDSENKVTGRNGEYSTKTKIYTLDYEYGLSSKYSLGIGTTFIDSHTKYRDTLGGFENDRIKGFTDFVINFKGKHAFNDTNYMFFGIKSSFAFENKLRNEVNSLSQESNASNGRHIFTPYIAYVLSKADWLLGLKLDYEFNTDKKTDFEVNGNATATDKSSGDNGLFVTLFYETLLSDNNKAGLLAKYSHFKDFKWNHEDNFDPSARADSILFQAYGNIDLGSDFELIPKVYYIIFNDKIPATSLTPDEVTIDNGGSFSFNFSIRKSF